MNLRILEQRPPNYDAVVAAFPGCEAHKPIFAYGDAIYNPFQIPVGRELVAHESVHCARQGGNPDAWWKSYIEDKQFRFTEELLAHQEEYRAYCDSARHAEPAPRDPARLGAAPRFPALRLTDLRP